MVRGADQGHRAADVGRRASPARGRRRARRPRRGRRGRPARPCTPVAPRATALTMSLPRRTPPSQMISVRSPTASTTGATRSIGAGAESSWRPPWLDRAIGVDAVLGGEHGVGDGLDALDDDRAVPHRAEPLDVVPRQVGVELRVDVVGQRTRRRCRRRPSPRRRRWRTRSARTGRTPTSSRGARRRRAACRARASAAARSPAARRARAGRARRCRRSARAPRSPARRTRSIMSLTSPRSRQA